jgi:hypothetical protein
MASASQIAANQRNARKSTGPRPGAGRERASRNAYRHGLTAGVTPNAAASKQLERLTRRIAGKTNDVGTIERARTIAQAELDLARVRQLKAALIARALAFENRDASPPFSSTTQPNRRLNALVQAGEAITSARSECSMLTTQLGAPEPERLAEAVRRALPELIKLERYERRFSALRDRAVLSLRALKRNTSSG